MRAIWILGVCVLTATRRGELPVELPVELQSSADPGITQPTLSASERAALAAAVADAQEWLLPSGGERDVATDAIAFRFGELAASLRRPETSALVLRIAEPRQELETGAAKQPSEQFIQFAAIGLVLNGVEVDGGRSVW